MKLLFIISITNCIMIIYLYSKLSKLKEDFIQSVDYLDKFRKKLDETVKTLIDFQKYSNESGEFINVLIQDHEESLKYLDKYTYEISNRLLQLEQESKDN